MKVELDGTRIQIELDEAIQQKIARAFSRSNQHPNQLGAAVARAALLEWINWLSADDRPLSITDQNTKRVLALYEEIYPTEVPDVELLYNDLKIPLGQARYISQSIGYQRGTYLQRLALEDIINAVASEITSWDGRPTAERDAMKDVTVKFKKSSERDYLDAIFELAVSGQIARPKASDELLRYVYYPIRIKDWARISKALLTKLEQLSPTAKQHALQRFPILQEATA